MDFKFTEEQILIRNMVTDFAQKEIAPNAALIDKTGEFPQENLRKMADCGLMGIPIPDEWGGAGADFLSYVITIEEIARACASTGVILAVHTSVGTMPILYHGNVKQKEDFVIPLAQGKKLGAFALTEASAGSDAANLKTKAVLKGDHYVVNGSKIFITNGGQADVYVTFVSTDPSLGKKGISVLLVDKSTPGFKVGKLEKKMGLNGSSTAELIFENAEVPKENLLGKEGEGFKIAMSLLDGGRIGIGAQGLGIARAAYDVAAAYLKERRQFGRPIADFQGLQFKLADMATRIEAARLLVYQAASLREAGRPYSKEAAMAKLFATDTAVGVTNQAVQLLGGYGYCRDYPVERLFRDAKITQIYEGTNQIQRLVIAKKVLQS